MKTAPRLGAVVLARMDSARLPGKVLAEVAGRPLLSYIIERLPGDIVSDRIVIATSSRTVDLPIVEFAAANSIACYRGSATDVTDRFLAAARSLRLDGAFRVNGDSPFVEARLIREAATLYRPGATGLITNLTPRSYPYGVSVELVDVRTLAALSKVRPDSETMEHVTRILYRDLPENQTIGLTCDSGRAAEDLTGIRLTIDTSEDLERFRRFVVDLDQPFLNVDHMSAVRSGYFR
ncbi:MAG: hypothetical protein ABJN75_21130 [Hoeflea sp.]|uniref:cytidylyltransferase domain-containing protein n=1 Tax=Hoeflea sp. TaxID=1940281 RepID=UPI00329A51C4